MLPPLHLAASLTAFGVVLGFGAIAALVGFADVLRARSTRVAVAVASELAAHAAWSTGHGAASYFGMVVAMVGLVVWIAFVASLPVAALVRVVLREALLRRAPPAVAEGALVGRRRFVAGATALVPLAAVGLGAKGFVGAGTVAEPIVRFAFDALAPSLDGLEILHLSDLHLGVGRSLADLERLLLRAEARGRPDLVVVTGDAADDLRLLPDALRLVDGLRARRGAFACLGNHEHLHDVRAARRAFDASPVRLLVDEATLADDDLAVVGVDDPVTVGADVRPWLRDRLGRALMSARASGAARRPRFRLLLAHRPEAIEPAAERGVDLVLSGHTHGGQIGFAGKSAFEPLYPDGYLWGPYARGATRLYTSAGFGHWFPFRLGCSAEAPRIVLASAAR